MKATATYAIMAMMLVLLFIVPLYAGFELPPYASWLGAVGLATFALYGLDKRMARSGRSPRVPERILNLLSLVGGFLGGWVGRAAFRHKTNLREHARLFAILVLATLLHGVLIYMLLTTAD
ncbi:MAG: DUF1294 domain-containing protein [Anaerolineales bacterium]|nr:MAG: DUF1294 domain-containing protein [Anaerolineales bacterium]